ncbi:MAG TPA: hypothetical protein VHX66_10410 [Solirubrobacteraceae bacterium]|jgi:hypothetical protein|nr:hypothetical protein [Solirubrobacteraceae bacterium]
MARLAAADLAIDATPNQDEADTLLRHVLSTEGASAAEDASRNPVASGGRAWARRHVGTVVMSIGPPRRRATRWGAVGVGMIAAVVVVLAVGTNGRGPAKAFAGWSAAPTTPDDGQLQAAESACQQRKPDLASITPTVTDTRGADSLLVYASDGATTTCVTGDVQLGTVALTRTAGNSLTSSGSIVPQSIGLEFAADGQAFREMTGQVGSDVTAVTVLLQGGSSVEATVASGWFAAWWPVSQDVETGQAFAQSLSQSVPQSFAITTASGTTTQALTLNEIQNAMQPSSIDGSYGATGSSGPVISGSGSSAGAAPAGMDPALWASLAVLRQPGPSPVPAPASLGSGYTPGSPATYPSGAPTNPYGINLSFDRFATGANAWVQAGSSGVCVVAYGLDVGHPNDGIGAAVCTSTATALGGDLLFRKGHVYVALAPDGNPTVTVTDTDGSTRQVPVTDNVYKIVGGAPSSITLRDASGALTTVPIPATGG